MHVAMMVTLTLLLVPKLCAPLTPYPSGLSLCLISFLNEACDPPSLFQNQAEAHYKGHRHARKLKAVEAAKSKQRPRNLTPNGTVASSALPPASGGPGSLQSKGQS